MDKPLHLDICTVPTFYFVGVTTRQSSIMKVFPQWMNVLGFDTQIVGVDAPLHAPAATYRAIVEHIKADPLVCGGLVTTDKIDLLHATQDMFDNLDRYAKLSGEVSCIAKRGDRLEGYAKDPISSGKTWQTFVPPGHFGHTDARVLCFGSGGAAVATTIAIANLADVADRPRNFALVDVSQDRLDHARSIHALMNTDIHLDYILNSDAYRNDLLIASLPPASVVINGTGMGKDLPGKPITEQAMFLERGLVWEYNYRGELGFLKLAQRQALERKLVIEDGWVYFLHGWTQVIAEIFQFNLTPEVFARLDQAAQPFR